MVVEPRGKQRMHSRVLLFAHIRLPNFPVHLLTIRAIARFQVLFQRNVRARRHRRGSWHDSTSKTDLALSETHVPAGEVLF
jgi:hypothetical protein